MTTTVKALPVESVERDPSQPRQDFDKRGLRELAASIKAQGQLQPIEVVESGTGYRIITGERRWRACQLGGLDTVDAIVRAEGQATLTRQVVENLVRADMNPIEEATAFSRLMADNGGKVETVGKAVSKPASYIARRLELLKLTDEAREAVRIGALKVEAANVLAGCVGEPELYALAWRRLNTPDGISARALETVVNRERNRANAGEAGALFEQGTEPATEATEADTRLAEAEKLVQATFSERLQEPINTFGSTPAREALERIRLIRLHLAKLETTLQGEI